MPSTLHSFDIPSERTAIAGSSSSSNSGGGRPPLHKTHSNHHLESSPTRYARPAGSIPRDEGTPPKSKSSENFIKMHTSSLSALADKDDPAAATQGPVATEHWSTFAVGGASSYGVDDEAGGLVLDDASGMHDTLSTSGSESELSMPLDVSPLTVETSIPQPPEGGSSINSPSLVNHVPAVSASDKKNV